MCSMLPRLTLLALVLSLSFACGHEPDASPHRRARVNVQTWDIGDDLARNKKVVTDAVRAQGGDDSLLALVLAVGMQETQHFTAAERDASKDGQGPAKNYSAYNMNADMLGRIGWSEGQGPDLNDQANLHVATELLVKAIRQFSEDGFLAFHRGGWTAYQDRCSYGCQDYILQIRATQTWILQGAPAIFTDGRRLGADVPHV